MAKKAFAQSLIDVSVSIYKKIILLVMMLPLTILINSIINNSSQNISLNGLFEIIGLHNMMTICIFVIIFVLIAESLRSRGLEILNQI